MTCKFATVVRKAFKGLTNIDIAWRLTEFAVARAVYLLSWTVRARGKQRSQYETIVPRPLVSVTRCNATQLGENAKLCSRIANFESAVSTN